MDTFLSGDWGTTSFRLRLVDMDTLAIQAEIKNNRGISQMAATWQQSEDTASRQDYYTDFLNQQIEEMELKLGRSLEGIPVVLSGMASSSIGLLELPYKELPFCIDGTDLLIQPVQNNRNPLLMISGVCTSTDVMRGEETKIVGIADFLPVTEQEQLLLLPGTHPKHVRIRDRQAVSFKTFMTGEFFALLSTNSILASSVKNSGSLTNPANRECFINAVHAIRTASLLHHSFMVRTNQILKGLPAEQNYHYLSGLLIGEELKTLEANVPVHLLGSAAHATAYTLACEALGIKAGILPDADEALIKGQRTLLLAHKLRIIL